MEAEIRKWVRMGKKEVCWGVLLIVLWNLMIILYKKLWLGPQRIRSVLQKQGINGPKPSFPFGNLFEMRRFRHHQPSLSLHHLDQWLDSVCPYFHAWKKRYGPIFSYSIGSVQHLYVGIPELIKLMRLSMSLDLGRPAFLTQILKPMLGEGIVRANGPHWAFQRNIIAPELFITKIKNMVDVMEECTMETIKKWESHISESEEGIADLIIDGDLKALTRNVFAKTCFGTSYFNKGNAIIDKLAVLQDELVKPTILYGTLSLSNLPHLIPKKLKELFAGVMELLSTPGLFRTTEGKRDECVTLPHAEREQDPSKVDNAILNSRLRRIRSEQFLPTRDNKEISKLQNEAETMILEILNEQKIENQKSGTDENQKYLLQTILKSAANATNKIEKGTFKLGYDTNKLLLDICKNMYFAGSDSTTLAITWTLMLLAVHPEWQQRVRSEIIAAYGNNLLHSFHDTDKLQKLKALKMVVQESLRLYAPTVTVAREILSDMKLGEHLLPKGINTWLFLPVLHRDPDNWGPDSREFKPERFANGLFAACKYPQVYAPFGFGTRTCLGQHFAIVELKIVICLLFSKFSFSISPNYRHCPQFNIMLTPKYGVSLLVSKLPNSTF
ncbi:hypothetical protein RJT34_17816 [Clitoria ternatea]|uniref:Cytochrome P450 n=1 Tax=Clitoria ternatea TaxID=43366 RepID=A0AAN9PF79_CLITE